MNGRTDGGREGCRFWGYALSKEICRYFKQKLYVAANSWDILQELIIASFYLTV